MPFEVNNFSLPTYNVVLVSEFRCFRKRCFRLRNLHFDCGTAFSFGNLQSHFWKIVKLWIFAIWFQKMWLLSQKAVSVSESGLYFEILVAAVCHHKPSASSRILYCGHSTQYSHLVQHFHASCRVRVQLHPTWPR